MTRILGREVIAERNCVRKCRSYGDGSSDLGFEGMKLIWCEARRTAVSSTAAPWDRKHARSASTIRVRVVTPFQNILPPASSVTDERFAA